MPENRSTREDELLRQQDALARFGELALRSDDLEEILHEACRLVGEALGTDLAKVMELQQDGITLLVRSGVGWKPGVVGEVAVRAEEGSSEGCALRTGRPVTSSDIGTETRFRYPDFLTDNGVHALVNVIIIGPEGERPYGILEVDSRSPRDFTEADTNFLRGYANLLAGAVARLRLLDEARSRETTLHRAQVAGGVGVFAVDIKEDVLTATPEFCRLFGVPVRDRLRPEELERLILPDHAASVSDATARAGGDVRPEIEYAVRRPDTGDVRWLSRRAEIERDGAGRPVRFFGVVRDITEQRRALDALARSEARYRALFDAIDEGFCIIEFFDGPHGPSSDYVHVEANPGYERHTGIPGIVGQTVRELAPEEAEGWVALYGGVLRTGEPIRLERDFVAAGRTIEVSAARIEPPDSRQVSVLFRDITERKRAETALRASEALVRENADRVQLALAAGAIIGTWFWDIPTDRFSIDEAFARAFGIDPALGRDGLSLAQVVDTVHPDDRAGLAAALDEAIARGGAYAHQYRTRRLDGNYYWLEANGRVDHAPDGTPLSFPGVLIDVEERRAVEAERDRAAADLRALTATLEQRVEERTSELLIAEEAMRQSQKMEAVGQLTGGVAHDFNNLLTIIRSSVDLLRRPGLAEERRRRYIDAVSDTVDRAAKLTGQLLAFARRQALKPEVLDVGARLGAIADMLDTVTGARIRITTEMPDAPCFIKADPSQFETALVNLAVNARDAMDGAGHLTLRLTCGVRMPPIRGHAGAKGPFAAVSLTDTGEGIPADRLSRIFEPFFTTKEVGKGTGLGLSQVFGFTKQSGGDVAVASQVGQGTTFTLYLPEVETEAPPVAGDQNAEAPSDGAGLRVLVVEDNIEVGRFATQILQDLGYETAWAANAEEALERLGQDGAGFDVVFSDVVMPGMGGIALARELRQRLPAMPVVLASGYSHVLAQEGAHGFELLNKPYSVDQLSRTLRRVIRT